MKKIKILHFSQVFGGGVEQYIKLYLKHSNKELFENSVLLPNQVDVNYYTEFVKSIYNIDISQSFSPVKLLVNILKVRKIIKKENPDLIYLHSTVAGVIGRLAALGLKSKVVYNPHGWSFKMNVSHLKKKFYQFIELSLSIITDKIILISQSEYDEAKNIHIEKDKLVLIYNGIDTEPKPIKKSINLDLANKYVIGMVGRISEQKNPFFFVEFAYKIYQQYPNSFFIIVGDGELREEIEKKIAEYKLQNNFLITGWVENPESYINIFNQAVLFSKWEGLSLAVIEYMLYKKPIIVADIEGMSELIEDNITGFTISPNDLNNAVSKSNSIRENTGLSMLLGENAYKKVLVKFSISKNIKEIENLFTHLNRG